MGGDDGGRGGEDGYKRRVVTIDFYFVLKHQTFLSEMSDLEELKRQWIVITGIMETHQ